jgi:hypothetical protein
MFEDQSIRQLKIIVHQLTQRVEMLEKKLIKLLPSLTPTPKTRKTKQNSQRKIKQEGEPAETKDDNLRTPD